MKKLAPLALAVAVATSVCAQTPGQPPPGGPPPPSREIPMLRISVAGGTFSAALRAVQAVTQHEYVVDGVARVTEVNIDTSGTLLARYYFLEPLVPNSPLGAVNAAAEQAQKLLQEGAEKTGQDVWKKVMKNYPTTTHARTVEYRVESLEQLGQIFQAADLALRTQRDTRITVQK